LEGQARVVKQYTEHVLIQGVCAGYTYQEVAQANNVDLEQVVDAVRSSSYFTRVTPAMRRHIALARLDAISKSLIPKASDGDYQAINAYLKCQEREAQLCGMDAAREVPSVVTINIPWLSKERLSYRYRDGANANADADADNVTDITPILDIKKAINSADTNEDDPEAWKERQP